MSGSDGPRRIEDRAIEILAESGGEGRLGDLARILFQTSSGEGASRVLKGLLSGDPRFLLLEDRIRLAPVRSCHAEESAASNSPSVRAM